MKVKLLKKLRKRFVWRYDKNMPDFIINKWRIFDKKEMYERPIYNDYERGLDPVIREMMRLIGLKVYFCNNLTRQKRRWSKTKKQNIINQFLNKTN